MPPTEPQGRNEAFGDFGHRRARASWSVDVAIAALVLLGVAGAGEQLLTQWMGQRLQHQVALGDAWVVGEGAERMRFYAPWKGYAWTRRITQSSNSAVLLRQCQAAHRRTLTAAAVAAAFVLSARRRRAHNRIAELHGSARWASKHDIERAGLLATTGVVVGGWVDRKENRLRYLRHDGPEHVLTFAPTGSGKGVGLVIPSLLSWKHSALVLDPKGENYALTSGYRRSLGQRVYKLDFASEPSETSAFNPLSMVRVGTSQATADAQRLARMIVDPDGKQFEGPGKHWAETGSSLLTGAILHVLYRERECGRVATMNDVINELTDRHRSHDEVLEDWLEYEHDPTYLEAWHDDGPSATHPVVAATAREQMNREEKERGAVLSSAVAPLAIFRDALLVANTSRSDFSIADLMDGEQPVTVYLVLRPADIHRLRPLVRIFLDLVLRRLVETMHFVAGEQVRAHRHRLLLMLDEFPVLGRLDVFSEALAYIRGWGIKAYLIAQDFEQLRAAYGERETISSNCHIKVAYAPTKLETAKLLSALVGTMTVIKRSPSRGGFGGMAQRTHESEQEVARPLLTPDECMQLPGAKKTDERITEAGDMLVMASGFPAVYGKQVLYFLDETLAARTRLATSPVSWSSPQPDSMERYPSLKPGSTDS